jgi:hypothetical protein
MIRAPVKKSPTVPRTWRGSTPAIGAARRVEKRVGKKR